MCAKARRRQQTSTRISRLPWLATPRMIRARLLPWARTGWTAAGARRLRDDRLPTRRRPTQLHLAHEHTQRACPLCQADPSNELSQTERAPQVAREVAMAVIGEAPVEAASASRPKYGGQQDRPLLDP